MTAIDLNNNNCLKLTYLLKNCNKSSLQTQVFVQWHN